MEQQTHKKRSVLFIIGSKHDRDGAKQTLMELFCFRGTSSLEDQCKFSDQLYDSYGG
jgi:hypothetical protein